VRPTDEGGGGDGGGGRGRYGVSNPTVGGRGSGVSGDHYAAALHTAGFAATSRGGGTRTTDGNGSGSAGPVGGAGGGYGGRYTGGGGSGGGAHYGQTVSGGGGGMDSSQGFQGPGGEYARNQPPGIGMTSEQAVDQAW
jgi:hypothetical protein